MFFFFLSQLYPSKRPELDNFLRTTSFNTQIYSRFGVIFLSELAALTCTQMQQSSVAVAILPDPFFVITNSMGLKCYPQSYKLRFKHGVLVHE